MRERPGPRFTLGPRHFTLEANLSATERQSLASFLTQHRYRPGEFVFHMGEEASCFYVVEKGVVKVSRMLPTGDERVIQLHKSRDTFGWFYMNRFGRWTVEAQALTSATVRTIRREAFMRRMQSIPDLSMNFIDNLIEQLRRMLVRVEALEHPEPGPRLLAILADLAEYLGEPASDSYTLPGFPTQGDLARMAGLNRSTVNLLINGYRREGILGGRRGVIVVYGAPTRAILMKAGFAVS